MGKILFVKKKIGKSYLIWFQNSNLYFNLEEPAWFVFRKTVKRYKSETIAKEFSIRYGLGYEDSLNFVVEIRQKINEMNQPNNHKEYIEKSVDKINNHVYSVYSRHCYNLRNKVIEFSYETSWLENYIHPLIKHLETTEEFNDKSHFELFTYKERVIFRVDNILKGSWTKNESGFVKGRVFVELINVLHNKTDADWLMTVHASAISNGRKTILFSAPVGSGKTTFAALLQTQGYHIISDDFVPIEQSSFKAYPLPIAMSVKEGSLELLTSHYPELDQSSLIYINSKKKVKYLPVDTKMMNMIFPVNEFVFIKYDNSVDFAIEKIDPVKAITQLLDEAWILPAPENVTVFLDRIVKASFYNLTYSNNQKAIEAVNRIFEND
jgi:dephospho-CoA kinase